MKHSKRQRDGLEEGGGGMYLGFHYLKKLGLLEFRFLAILM